MDIFKSEFTALWWVLQHCLFSSFLLTNPSYVQISTPSPMRLWEGNLLTSWGRFQLYSVRDFEYYWHLSKMIFILEAVLYFGCLIVSLTFLCQQHIPFPQLWQPEISPDIAKDFPWGKLLPTRYGWPPLARVSQRSKTFTLEATFPLFLFLLLL